VDNLIINEKKTKTLLIFCGGGGFQIRKPDAFGGNRSIDSEVG